MWIIADNRVFFISHALIYVGICPFYFDPKNPPSTSIIILYPKGDFNFELIIDIRL